MPLNDCWLVFLYEAFCFGIIIWVEFKAGAGEAKFEAGKCCIANAEEWVEDHVNVFYAVKLNAHLWDFGRKCGGVGALFCAIFDGFIRDKPRVAPTATVFPCGFPAGDVALVLIFNTDAQAVEFDVLMFGKVKDVFVAIVDKTRAVDGFEVAYAYVARDMRIVADIFFLNSDRFDPVDHILKREMILHSAQDFKWYTWI